MDLINKTIKSIKGIKYHKYHQKRYERAISNMSLFQSEESLCYDFKEPVKLSSFDIDDLLDHKQERTKVLLSQIDQMIRENASGQGIGFDDKENRGGGGGRENTEDRGRNKENKENRENREKRRDKVPRKSSYMTMQTSQNFDEYNPSTNPNYKHTYNPNTNPNYKHTYNPNTNTNYKHTYNPNYNSKSKLRLPLIDLHDNSNTIVTDLSFRDHALSKSFFTYEEPVPLPEPQPVPTNQVYSFCRFLPVDYNK